MLREAVVYYAKDWQWPGKPWPWCPWAERELLDGTKVAAVPHDNHMTNGGNTACPGVPGLIEEREILK